MSDQPQSYTFPQRAPLFTAAVVIAGVLLFGYLIHKVYQPAAAVDVRGNVNLADLPEDQRWKAGAKTRDAKLAELRAAAAAANSYGWVDKNAGIARLPIDQAIKLTVRDHARK